MAREWLGVVFSTGALLALGTTPAAAADTAVTVSTATVSGSSISVAGNVAYGADATGALTLSTDPAGDTQVPGMDLGNLTVRTDVAARRLIWTLELKNGLQDPVGGPPPALTGFIVPVMVDDQDFWRWLGAGTAGTALGQTGKWTGLCSNETASGTQGGWGCPGVLAGAGTYSYSGSITASGISWTQPFSQMKPQIQYGSVVTPSSIHGGAPISMAWPPGLLGAAAPIDTGGFASPYKVPGEVKVAVTAAGSLPSPDAFATKATFNGTTGNFTASVPAGGTGARTVWVQTCYGNNDTPTCVTGSKDVTV